MSDSLPTEILETIIEDVISEYAKTITTNHRSTRLIPRWYLLSILQVSRQWNAVCTKYLYCFVAVGGSAPFELPAIEKEPYCMADERYHLYVLRKTRSIRTGFEVTEDLYRTLSANSWLTTFITTLQLGIGSDYQKRYQHSPASEIMISTSPSQHEWTETHIRILQLCPNVEHVDIRGFKQSNLNALVGVLKEKSLVSLSLTTLDLDHTSQRQGNGGSFSQILDMMRKWPKLQSIRVDKFLMEGPRLEITLWRKLHSRQMGILKDAEPEDDPKTLATSKSRASYCCPDLREIVITGAVLRASQFRLIRDMCNGAIAKLAVSLYGRHLSTKDVVADALCECLQSWSSTLEYLKIDADYRDPYPPLDKAIGTLQQLRELQLGSMKVDFGSIYRLPVLERFACFAPHSIEEVHLLASYLEDAESFPSLKVLVLRIDDGFSNNVKVLCDNRKITFGSFQTSDFIL